MGYAKYFAELSFLKQDAIECQKLRVYIPKEAEKIVFSYRRIIIYKSWSYSIVSFPSIPHSSFSHVVTTQHDISPSNYIYYVRIKQIATTHVSSFSIPINRPSRT